MTEPKTLLQLSGANLAPARMSNSSLILIDFQNEYLTGPIAVDNAQRAIARAAHLLSLARQSGAPVFHIAHKGRPGGLFDRAAERGQIVPNLLPQADEAVVEKGLPNAFAGTELEDLLARTGREDLILAGFMTHMCVSATARAALDLGYRVTIDGMACATRDLPDGCGGRVAAQIIHDVSLVALSDRFAIITRDPTAFA